MLPSNAVYSCDGAGCERDGSTCENESCDRTEEARPQGCEATRDENVEGKGAREGSPGFTLKQTTLSQVSASGIARAASLAVAECKEEAVSWWRPVLPLCNILHL